MHSINDKVAYSSLIQSTTHGASESIAILRLNRPERANAYNAIMLNLFEQKVRTIIDKKKVRVLIITGEGERAFCAGSDRDELKGRRILDGLNLKSRELFDLLAELPIPTIAAINGAVVGGGLELALACDIRVCTTTAKFSFPELSLGLSPAAGGMIRLPATVGRSCAKEMILFGRILDAATAFERGLVSYVGNDFETKALALAEWAAAQDSLAMSLSKKVIESDPHFSQHDLSAVVQALLYEQKHING
jgi:enoyl-CoA hydratase/carnithine racemase